MGGLVWHTGPIEQRAPFPEWSQVPATRGTASDRVWHRAMVLQYSCLLLFWNDSSNLRSIVIPEKLQAGILQPALDRGVKEHPATHWMLAQPHPKAP